MKTFKLVSFDFIEQDEFHPIEILDGLIINKEDEQNNWLIEVYTKAENLDMFEKAMHIQKEGMIRVVITKKDNDPVYFQIKIVSIKKMGDKISIILSGKIKTISRSKYAENMLKNLIDNGLTGDTLLSEFKDNMEKKPYITLKNNGASSAK